MYACTVFRVCGVQYVCYLNIHTHTGVVTALQCTVEERNE